MSELKTVNSVSVTNTGKREFEDGFAGERYDFVPGKRITIPYAAAVHIFGHNVEDKESVLARLGWIRTRNELKEGLKMLAEFKIEDEGTRHSLSPVVERVPLQSPKGAGGKLVSP